MEVKVSVDGIPRVVCGVTEATTCQEVVIVLAQALGQAGRYTLREKFKHFERCMTPGERLLETIEKYGEQANEVQLTLIHNASSVWDDMSRSKGGRYQPCPPLRRKDAGTRMLRGGSSHRQSLPPLSCLREEAEQQKEDLKRPKRKSLTFMEEAWEWLESLGKGKVYSTTSDKESSRRTDRRTHSIGDVSLSVDKENSGRSSRSKVRGKEINRKPALDHPSSCCRGSQTKVKNSREAQSEDVLSPNYAEHEKKNLGETIIRQLSCLQDLQVQMKHMEKQISELVEKRRSKQCEQEALQRIADEEIEQIKFWENELKAEEGYEKDLQCQFVEMRVKAAECKVKLENYRSQIQGFDLYGQRTVLNASTKDQNQQQSEPQADENTNRKSPPKGDKPPRALVTPNQTRQRRPTGPTELREWWKRWSETQKSQQHTNNQVIHRSELTIYLGSTKV